MSRGRDDQEGPGPLLLGGRNERLRTGEQVIVDGVIVDGRSTLDESMVTGESIPVSKTVGDTVIGATINQTGAFRFEATNVGADTMLSQIIKAVEQAQGSKASNQRLADLVSSYFVPAVMFIAIATFVIWFVVGPEPAVTMAMVAAVSVLIIACPVPLAWPRRCRSWSPLARGAEHGILIRSAEALETAHEFDTIVLDETPARSLAANHDDEYRRRRDALRSIRRRTRARAGGAGPSPMRVRRRDGSC